MKGTKKQHVFAVDREKRNKRRRAPHRIQQTYKMRRDDGSWLENTREIETSVEQAEGRQIVAQLARTFIGEIEFHKTEYGGSQPHDEAVKEALSMSEYRREYVQGLPPEKVDWSHIAAIGEISMEDGLKLWSRVREAADGQRK
jgi:hypothetical protein